MTDAACFLEFLSHRFDVGRCLGGMCTPPPPAIFKSDGSGETPLTVLWAYTVQKWVYTTKNVLHLSEKQQVENIFNL